MLLVEQEVVQPTLGVVLVSPHSKSAAFNQELGVETLQWVTTLVVLERDMVVLVGTVTVTTTKVYLQVLHSWVLWVSTLLLDTAGFVAVVGEFLTHMVVREQLRLTVKDAADKVEQVVVVLLKSATCDPSLVLSRPRKGSFFMFCYK